MATIVRHSVRKFYDVKVYPSGRFVIEFVQQGLTGDKREIIRDMTIPGTSPSPEPLIDQAESEARNMVEMDMRQRIRQERDQAGARKFTINA